MHRLVLPLLLATVGASCTDRYYPSPFIGDWRVDRAVRTATPGCPSLTLPPLLFTLHSGVGEKVDLGPQQSDVGENEVTPTDVIFTTSELAFSGSSDTLIIRHDLETQLHEADLVGTATAQGDGSRAGCRWDMDAVATNTSR